MHIASCDRATWRERRLTGASHVPVRTENADIGLETFKAFGGRLEKAGFFEGQEPATDAVATVPPGTRISAFRDDRRTTWNSGGPRRA
jgi:hypothetical protein